MNVLILIGAGTSVELGVPTMTGLAEEFVEHAEQWDVESSLVKDLLGKTNDIEHLIERLDQMCMARESLESLGQDSAILDRADTIRAEVEWFVQHAAERIVPREAHLLWGPVLRMGAQMNLTIASTNYDRAIELAANAEGATIDDGYTPFGPLETSSWQGFTGDDGAIRLIKMHGSTDWYLEENSDEPRKLRHPMPLFGRASLRLPSGLELGSALILPSREKLLTRQPYPRLSQAFLNAVDSCDIAIVVGSSLRDHHLRGAVKSMADRVPVFIVNRQGSVLGLESAKGIQQTASVFLTGTLPLAMRSSDPILALGAATEEPVPLRLNCLGPLAVALDTEATEAQRCAALDELEAAGVPLDTDRLHVLIEDASPEVARYSLGFVAQGPDAAALLSVAESSVHAEAGSPFREDLALMRSMFSLSDTDEAANQVAPAIASDDG